MRLKLLTFFILLAFFALSACAWKGDKQLLPIDDELVLPFSGKTLAGTLENGFKYYIRYNDFPPDKIELILNVRTGSLNETEEERGVA
ncbi:MAG: hypothetical protein LBP51_02825, partial [Deferribacteraceae bacterium]|nr:hypothetical protein [Deferribacteraceae bacterium]